MTAYYDGKLSEAMEYQDFVADQLRRQDSAIIIMPYCSTKYQYERGESASGIEIKFDGRMAETGNIYIETAEKTDPTIAGYTTSGIYRNDNTWLYLIGNYDTALLFSKAQLRMVYEDKSRWGKRGILPVQTPTSIGMLWAVEKAKATNLCLRTFQFDRTTE